MYISEKKRKYFYTYPSVDQEQLEGPYCFNRTELQEKFWSIVKRYREKCQYIFSYQFSIEFLFGFLQQIPREILEREIKGLPSQQECYGNYLNELINYTQQGNNKNYKSEYRTRREQQNQKIDLQQFEKQYEQKQSDEYISKLQESQLEESTFRKKNMNEQRIIKKCTKEDQKQRKYWYLIHHIKKLKNTMLLDIINKHLNWLKGKSESRKDYSLNQLFVHLFFLTYQEIRSLCYNQKDLWYITWEIKNKLGQYTIGIKKNDLNVLASIVQIKQLNSDFTPKNLYDNYIEVLQNRKINKSRRKNNVNKGDQIQSIDRYRPRSAVV